MVWWVSRLYTSNVSLTKEIKRLIYVDMKSMIHREKDLGRFNLMVPSINDNLTFEESKILPGDYLSVNLSIPSKQFTWVLRLIWDIQY